MHKASLRWTPSNVCLFCRFQNYRSPKPQQFSSVQKLRPKCPPNQHPWPTTRNFLLSNEPFDSTSSLYKSSSQQRWPRRKTLSTSARCLQGQDEEPIPKIPNLGEQQSTRPNSTEDIQVVFENASDGEARIQDSADEIDAHDRLEEQHDSDTAEFTPEEVAIGARRYFGDRLPEGALNEEQMRIYERLYGTPLVVNSEVRDESFGPDVLLKEGQDGVLEEVEISEHTKETSMDDALPEELISPRLEVDQDETTGISVADQQLQSDIRSALAAQEAEEYLAQEEKHNRDEHESDPEYGEEAVEDETTRAHPFTIASRFATNPRTLQLPKEHLVDPITGILADVANKHLDELAHKTFGGPGLPYATGTPLSSRTMPQKPIPLTAGQNRMQPMEANAFVASLYPGIFAAVTGILVETRKRLGTDWIRGLLTKPGGPRILDADGGGAGVLAWREILRAEWYGVYEGTPEELIPPVPIGKATVLTGSDNLRHRASLMLENTTFLPRLPDYVHTTFTGPEEPRKQFDIVIAPYSLWQLQEPYERRQKVLNLWSLLDASDGVLVLMEKGVPRGFEVLADARAYILSELFEKDSSIPSMTPEEPFAPSAAADLDPSAATTSATRRARSAPGRIIAPCPHHAKCPMYLVPGVSRQRKDYCRFTQRYIRPPFYQRLLSAKDRNHEDVEFSYIVVQKGVSAVDKTPLLGKAATERAFRGYDLGDEDINPPEIQTSSETAVGQPISELGLQEYPSPRSPLPRQILPPLKRHGHVVLDVCTPSGSLERWTVTRSYGKVPYRDARKSRWGDLWALGAKQRVEKNVRLGKAHAALKEAKKASKSKKKRRKDEDE